MAGNIVAKFDNVKTGTGTVTLDGFLFGGVDLNSDGTNAGTVVIRENDANGKVLLSISSVVGKTVLAPFKAKTHTIYYSISGTGADAMLYEWVE